eukprot:CAMPEP_0197186418 /NCGR_PEP_ID=MMETSP1423-20130617/13882_1 /TAXON_ID=476441 /ORGANISM="Pseudo-nitzschia heimii, Strain UNC1101" /LENGTH=325 /DNA_ID=CAMNT_0042637733 /DNA_START=72 /DNA_END=1049 /DNA_ORIENTATION=+
MTTVITVPIMVTGTVTTSLDYLPSITSITPPNKLSPQRGRLLDIIAIRGGKSEVPYQQHSFHDTTFAGGSDDNFGDESARNYENGFANYNPPSPSRYGDDKEEAVLQESVQARHDNWKSAQMQNFANRTPEQEHNVRDEQGRMKLMSSVSKGSRAFIFFILMWRDIYLFEVTDQSIKGSLYKNIYRGILTTVFLGNLAGVVTSLTSQGHSAKNRLKAILNLDKVIETALLVWNLGRVTLFPSKFIPREIFVAGILHSCFFLIQCQAFTRVAWDERVAPVFQQKQHHQRRQEDTTLPMNESQGTSLGGNDFPDNYAMYAKGSHEFK